MAKPYYYGKRKIGVIDSQNRLVAFKDYKMVFRQYNSLGFELSILNDLLSKRIDTILIIFKKQDGTEELFITKLADWDFLGKVWKDKNFGIQKHLTLAQLRELTKRRNK